MHVSSSEAFRPDLGPPAPSIPPSLFAQQIIQRPLFGGTDIQVGAVRRDLSESEDDLRQISTAGTSADFVPNHVT